MLRRMAIVLAVLGVVLAVPSQAVLGGGSVFAFDRRYFVAGDHARGYTGFYFSAKDRRLLDRSFHAYLIPSAYRWIEPPLLPSGAIPLGPVSISAGRSGGLARVSFVVPDVAPGNYTVGICDVPCRHAFLGDLIGGWITVVGSPEEARLRGRLDRLQNQLSRVESDLERKLQKERQRRVTLQSQIDDLTDRLTQHQASLQAALAGLAQKPSPGTNQFDRAGWVIAVGAVAVLAFVLSRRRKSPAAPAPEPLEVDILPLEADFGWRTEAVEETPQEDRTPVGVG